MTRRAPSRSRRAVRGATRVLVAVVVLVLSWGSVRGYFAHPARVGVVAVVAFASIVGVACTSGVSRGLVADPDARWFFPMLRAVNFGYLIVPPFMDARGLWVLPGGDRLRYAGLGVLVVGAALRYGAMILLGRRFSGVVARQQSHRLQTTGLYAHVRHPSYIGALLILLGVGLVFRSPVGVALVGVVCWMIVKRMDREEAFMTEQFGDKYRAYCARTRRLLPGIY